MKIAANLLWATLALSVISLPTSPARAQAEGGTQRVDAEKFKLGKRIFDKQHKLTPQRMNNKDYADQQEYLLWMHQALPKDAQKDSPLPELVGRLSPEEAEAVHYYVTLKYHVPPQRGAASAGGDSGSGSGDSSGGASASGGGKSSLPIKLDMGGAEVNAERYQHGLRVFRKNLKFSTRSLDEKQLADQREYILWLHNVLPEDAKKHSPLPELVGRLSDEDIDALHYYLVLKYKIPVERKAE